MDFDTFRCDVETKPSSSLLHEKMLNEHTADLDVILDLFSHDLMWKNIDAKHSEMVQFPPFLKVRPELQKYLISCYEWRP